MNLGPTNESKSTAIDTAVTDQGSAVVGKGNVGPGSVANEGNYLTQDAVQILGGKLNTGVDLTNVSGGVQFGTSSEQLAKITDSFAKASSDSSKAITDLLDKVLDSQSANTGDAINKITDLAENKQTDGESGKNKIVLYVVAGVLALVAFIFWKK